MAKPYPLKTVDSASAMPEVPVAVLARMSSVRLPGKALRNLGPTTLLGSVVNRVRGARRASEAVVLTSTDPGDDVLAEWAGVQGIKVFRGDLDNVALRILQFAQQRGVPAVVRISGDSPFIDPALIDAAILAWAQHKPDLVTNVHPRSFPRGQSVEVVSTEALRRLLSREAVDLAELEHVTTHFYRHPERWRIVGLGPEASGIAAFRGRNLASLQLSVDDEDDLRRARSLTRMLANQCNSSPTWQDVAMAYLDLVAADPVSSQ